MFFPTDAINVRTDINGNVSSTLATINQTSTVLYESFNSGDKTANANLRITCGSSTLLNVNDYATVPNIERFKMAKCNENIVATVAGTSNPSTTTISLVYVPYDTATIPTSTIELGTQSVAALEIVNTNIKYFVIMGMVLVAIALFSLIRLLFIPKRRL